MKAKIELPQELTDELAASDLNLVEILKTENPELKSINSSEDGAKGTVEILQASAALIGALSPIIIALLKRLMPLKKIEIVEERSDNTMILKINYREE